MPSFLTEIDDKFNKLLRKKTIIKNDLLELKAFIINVYENDMNIDIIELKNYQRKILIDNEGCILWTYDPERIEDLKKRGLIYY